MTLPNVIDQHRDIESMHKIRKFFIIRRRIGSEVHRKDFRLHTGVLGFDFDGEGIKLGESAGDEDDVETLGGKLKGEFFSDAVRGAGDDGPGAFGAKFADLRRWLGGMEERWGEMRGNGHWCH